MCVCVCAWQRHWHKSLDRKRCKPCCAHNNFYVAIKRRLLPRRFVCPFGFWLLAFAFAFGFAFAFLGTGRGHCKLKSKSVSPASNNCNEATRQRQLSRQRSSSSRAPLACHPQQALQANLLLHSALCLCLILIPAA